MRKFWDEWNKIFQDTHEPRDKSYVLHLNRTVKENLFYLFYAETEIIDPQIVLINQNLAINILTSQTAGFTKIISPKTIRKVLTK